MAELRAEAGSLEAQVAALGGGGRPSARRLADAPKRVRTLEERLLETKGQLQQALSQNERLTYTLREAREHIASLREEVDKLTQPPSAYGTFLRRNDDGTADVFSGGRKMRVALHPALGSAELRRGQEVVLNESLNVVMARGTDLSGEVVTMKDVLDDGHRAIVVGRADEERVVELAESSDRREAAGRGLAAHGRPLGPAAREAAPAGGRGARPRGGARHFLRGRRRPRLPDRTDHRRRRAAVPVPGALRRAQAARAQRASCCTGRRAAARP